MESQPQNPEFRINPENFQPCLTHRHTAKTDIISWSHVVSFLTGLTVFDWLCEKTP